MHKLIKLIVKTILIGFVLLSNSNSAEAKTVSGQLIRPIELSNSQNLITSLSVTSLDQDGFFVDSASASFIQFVAGTDSLPFSLDVETIAGGEIYITYTCNFCERILDQGFYSTAGTTYQLSNAERLSVSADLTDLNFFMRASEVISGHLARPQIADSSQTIFATVIAHSYDSEGNRGSSHYRDVIIPSGNQGADFFIDIPPLEGGQYTIEYQCFSCSEVTPQGFYSTSGTQVRPESASRFTRDDTLTNKDITMLSPYVMSGTISRPDGADASSRIDVQIEASVYNENGNSINTTREFISLESNELSKSYSISVSPDSSQPVQLKYVCYGCFDIAREGYYSDSGTQASRESASTITPIEDVVGVNETTGLDITMLAPKLVLGTVSRPQGADTSDPIFGSIEMLIFDAEGNQINSVGTSFTIDSSSDESTYRIQLPPRDDFEYELMYSCFFCNGVTNRGWYSSQGINFLQSKAKRLTNGTDLTTLDFELLATVNVTGTLMFPTGVTSESNTGATLTVSGRNSTLNIGDSGTQFVNFSAGEFSKEFSIAIAPIDDGEYTLSYECSLCPGVAPKGYFNSAGTAPDSSQAEQLNNTELSGLAFQMLEPLVLSGRIVRPQGSNLESSLNVQVKISVNGLNNQFFFTPEFVANITLPAGQLSAQYQVELPPSSLASYSISYECSNCVENGLNSRGVYVRDGESSFSNNGSRLYPDDNLSEINITLEKLQRVTGTISLPSSFQPESSVEVEVQVQGSSGSFRRSQPLFLSIDKSSANFELNVPSSPNLGYRVSYTCFSGCRGLVGSGYFDGSKLKTSSDNQAPRITANQASQPINLELIEEQVVTLELARPAGVSNSQEIAPFVEVTRLGATGLNSAITQKRITIEAGKESTTVQFTAPGDNDARDILGYYVRYSCFNCPDIKRNGYINLDNVVEDRADQEVITSLVQLSNTSVRMLKAKSLLGTVTRPQGSDDSSDLSVSIATISESPRGLYSSLDTTQVVIPAGKASADFNLYLTGPGNYKYTVRYECGDCRGIYHRGYYSIGRTSTQYAQARKFNENSAPTRIELQLVESTEISGVISRPQGFDNQTRLFMNVRIDEIGTGGVLFPSYEQVVAIPAGTDSLPYTLSLPPLENSLGRIYYQCFSCSGILNQGYLTQSGMSDNADESLLLNLGEAQDNINLELISAIKLTGLLERPEGSDRDQNIEARVSIAYIPDEPLSSTRFFEQTLQIAAGEESANFEISVPPSDRGSYRLRYSCSYNSCLGINTQGYKTATSSTVLLDEAALLDESDFDGGIEFQMISSVTLKGTVSRSSTATINTPITLTVRATATTTEGLSLPVGADSMVRITIPAGSMTVPYELNVPPQVQYQVSYICEQNCSELVNHGFYSSSGTTVDRSSAETLTSSDDLNNVSIDLVEFSASANGTIFRPLNSPTDKAVDLELVVTSLSDEGSFISRHAERLIVPAGDLSQEFSVNVPPGAKYEISYTCRGRCAGMVKLGYVGKNGVFPAGFESSAESFSEAELNGISVNILPTREISGSLKLPLSALADKDITLVVVSGRNTQELVISAGQNSTNFNLEVPFFSDGEYSLSYSCRYGCDGLYQDEAFYNSAGTVLRSNDRETWGVNDSFTGRDISVITTTLIEGRISRPTGSPTHSIKRVTLLALPFKNGQRDLSSDTAQSSSIIVPGSNSTSYSLEVPEVSSIDYRVSYVCYECDNVSETGYYNSSGTVSDVGEAQDLAQPFNQQYNIEMLGQVVLSGIVRRPELTPTDIDFSAELFVSLLDTQKQVIRSVSQTMNFQNGSLRDNFSFEFEPAEASYIRLSYMCNNCPQVLTTGFYTNGQTVQQIELASLLPFTSNDEIGFTMLDSTHKDGDSDGWRDELDNCPAVSNADQQDIDQDLLGDVCDSDIDGDRIVNSNDNCPSVSNPSQSNLDRDSNGDACDSDVDGDGVPKDIDTDDLNPRLCADLDLDSCDDCSSGKLNISNDGPDLDQDGFCDLGDNDDDNDLIDDNLDNCPLLSNIDQHDLDNDGIGDLCDNDKDGDLIPDNNDNCPTANNPHQNINACQIEDLCFTVLAKNGKASLICL